MQRKVQSKLKGLTSLGHHVKDFQKLDTFPRPKNLKYVELTSDEVGALCPVTSAPDFYTVTIKYHPKKLVAESKAIKLLLQSYRNKGIFCEAFSAELAQIFANVLKVKVECQVLQKPRGGIAIKAISIAFPKRRSS